MTERVRVVAFADPSGKELPEFPDRLRAAGIAEEDFKNVMQKCLDVEYCKIATLPITILTGGLGAICFCIPGVPCDITRGMRAFNKKYKPQGIKCEKIAIAGHVFDFVVPAQAAFVCRFGPRAPVSCASWALARTSTCGGRARLRRFRSRRRDRAAVDTHQRKHARIRQSARITRQTSAPARALKRNLRSKP